MSALRLFPDADCGESEDMSASQSSVAKLLESAKRGEQPALARLLTVLEAEGPALLAQFPELLQPTRMAFRVGITGPPGAGKSTLISRLIGEWRTRGLRVGVLAVDPSSPFSHGAILGDRIRYTEFATDREVFIRSLGTRGSTGGLSASAWLMVRAFDIAGYDVVLMETVGVGQNELEIMNVADHVSVVLTPESGDGVQGMKAGLMEIARLFVVNKADRPDAERFQRELEAALEYDAQPRTVLCVSALHGRGVHELAQALEAVRVSGDWVSARNSQARWRAEARALLMIDAERKARIRASQIETLGDFATLMRELKASV